MRDYAIIVAADLPTADQVLSVVTDVGPIVDGVKVGVPTLLETGVTILRRIRDLIGDKPLLVDLKIADIGFLKDGEWQGTNAKIVQSIADSGATHVTVHGFPGAMSVAEAVAVAGRLGLEVLLLPVMSHAGARLFFSRPISRSDVVYSTLKAGLDIPLTENVPCSDVTEGILLLGEALNVGGYIGPATRPTELQRYRLVTKKPVWCPGFGRQDRLGRSLKEQFREWGEIVGPASAAIVGSTIVNAEDPISAAREVKAMRDEVTG
jgi:orotidine 5'-phosphate decarboxylase subfamily 1